MATIRHDVVSVAINRAYALIDYSIQNTPEKEHEFRKQTILADEYLIIDEKSYAIKRLNKGLDYYKLLFNKGTKRICENCQVECLATLYCEHCVRNYLRANFSNWTSGNNDIDDLIQKCQMETIVPYKIVEWIPYNNLQDIKYLTKGGCSEIYTAEWIDGRYEEWDSKEKQLKRIGRQNVVLKRLENVESANRSWLEEGESHLMLSTRHGEVVQCYGLTKDPIDGNYMLVMNKMDINLGKYLQENHNKLTWKERIQIAFDIIFALLRIHQENAIHRDLHSGNILFSQINQGFYISDLGFCGPTDKPLNSIYGNLPYIAPEVIAGKETTFASDVYSIGMLMWEISSGQSPFAGFDHDYDLAMNIINGMRPRIVPGAPLEYKKLMEDCWNADTTKRPDINYLDDKIHEINKSYQNESKEHQINSSTNIYNSHSISSNFSKIHIFEILPEPRNATEEEQEAYHSIQNDLRIPDNILSEGQTVQNDSTISDNDNKVKENSKRIYSSNFDDESENLADNSKRITLSNDKEIDVEYTNNVAKSYNASDDDDDTYNNPNLHTEEQDELEIPDDI